MIIPSDQFKAELAKVMQLRQQQNPSHLKDFEFVNDCYVKPALSNLQRVTDFHKEQLAKQKEFSL